MIYRWYAAPVPTAAKRRIPGAVRNIKDVGDNKQRTAHTHEPGEEKQARLSRAREDVQPDQE